VGPEASGDTPTTGIIILLLLLTTTTTTTGARSDMVEALHYKLEGRRVDSHW
jgi:hypothetical protein